MRVGMDRVGLSFARPAADAARGLRTVGLRPFSVGGLVPRREGSPALDGNERLRRDTPYARSGSAGDEPPPYDQSTDTDTGADTDPDTDT